jgi:hypothetical protein
MTIRVHSYNGRERKYTARRKQVTQATTIGNGECSLDRRKMARRESTRMQAALREYAGRRRYREQGKRSWVTCFPKMETSSSPNGASSVSGSPGDGAESRRVSRRGDQRGRRNRSQLIRQLRAILHHGTLDVYTCQIQRPLLQLLLEAMPSPTWRVACTLESAHS